MKWYVATIIVSYQLRYEKQDVYPVDELFLLFCAENRKEALEKAIETGKTYNDYDKTLTLNGKPAYAKYEGVRKVIEIIDKEFDLKIPLNGIEIAYSYMEVNSIEALKKLGKGEAVRVNYIDMDE
jgi:hypothetical protein